MNTDHIIQVPLSEIKTRRRVRSDLGPVDRLARSMQKYGLLHPIVLDEKFNLIAGRRRLEAARRLGWETISAKIVAVTDRKEKLIIELEENSTRKDFTADDWARGREFLKEYSRRGWHWRVYYFFVRLFRRLFGRE